MVFFNINLFLEIEMIKHTHGYTKEANLSADAKLVRLLGVVSKLDSEIVATQNQEVVLVIGSTGAGKSTFINYFSGREMVLDSSQMEDAVVCKNPLATIGHGSKACTDRPTLYQEPNSSLILSDCPGFFDNRGVDVEVANAIGIQSMAKNSKRVKGIILIIEKSSLIAGRGKGLEESLAQTLEFLGSDLSNHLDSILVLISKVPHERVARTYTTLAEDVARFPLCTELLRKGNLGFYSPLDDFEPGNGVLSRKDLSAIIQGFKGIDRSERTFNIAISPEAKLEVTGLITMVSSKTRNHLAKHEFEALPHLLQLTSTFSSLNIDRVNNEIEKMESSMVDQIRLFEFDTKGMDHLTQLKKIMPPTYQPVIDKTLKNLQERLHKEQKLESDRKKTEAELNKSQQSISHLKNEQTLLQQSLQESKISQQEYEKQNKALQVQMERTKEHYKETERNMGHLQNQLADAKNDSARIQDVLTSKLDQAEKKAEARIKGLQSELENRNNEPQARVLYFFQQVPRPMPMWGAPPCGMPMFGRK